MNAAGFHAGIDQARITLDETDARDLALRVGVLLEAGRARLELSHLVGGQPELAGPESGVREFADELEPAEGELVETDVALEAERVEGGDMDFGLAGRERHPVHCLVVQSHLLPEEIHIIT